MLCERRVARLGAMYVAGDQFWRSDICCLGFQKVLQLFKIICVNIDFELELR